MAEQASLLEIGRAYLDTHRGHTCEVVVRGRRVQLYGCPPGSRLPCPDTLKQPLSSVRLPLPSDAKAHARNVYAKLRNHTPLVRALDLLCLFGEPAKEEWGTAWGGEATLVLSWYLRSPKKVALTGVKLSDYLAYAPATLGQVPRTFATLDAIQKENA